VSPGQAASCLLLDQHHHSTSCAHNSIWQLQISFQREWLQVQAEVLETSMQDLQTRLAQAQQELVLKRQTVEGLTHKFDRQVGLVLNSEAALHLL